MTRSLRHLFILAALASALAGGMPHARADGDAPDDAVEADDEESPALATDEEQSPDEPSNSPPTPKVETVPNVETVPKVESLLPDPENLIPHFEPDAGQIGGPDTGFTPPRWLDQNYQFLNEGDPYPPGQDPFRERPGLPVGWFAGVDLYVVHPEIDSQVNNRNLSPGNLSTGDLFHGTCTNSTQLPVGDMNWTVMPKIHVGYRFENGLGEFIASYRYLQADSSGTLANFDAAGAGQLNTRTQAHVLDLVYAFSDRTEGLAWYFPTVRRYGLGLRVASWVFDTTATGAHCLSGLFPGRQPWTRAGRCLLS